MVKLPNLKLETDEAMDAAYKELGDTPAGVEKSSVAFRRKQYTQRMNVLRWIPAKHHEPIRNGTCFKNLTKCVEAALDDVYVRPVGAAHFSPRLFFPAGVYPVRNLRWNGRVGLEGEGPGATRLVYHPTPSPDDPSSCSGGDVSPGEALIRGSKDGLTGQTGVADCPSLDHCGITDMSLLGYYAPLNSNLGTPSGMAAHLLYWVKPPGGSSNGCSAGNRFLVDMGYRLDRVHLGLCRQDAVLIGNGVTNAHMERIVAFAVGGYVFTIGFFQVTDAAGLCDLETLSGSEMRPLTIRRFQWRSALEGVSADLAESLLLLAKLAKTDGWGKGFIRFLQPSGIQTSLELGHVRVTKPSPCNGIVSYEWPEPGQATSVHLESITGKVESDKDVALVRLQGHRTEVTARQVYIEGMGSMVRKTQKGTKFPGDEASKSGADNKAVSDDDACWAGVGWLDTAMEYQQSAGLHLGSRRLEVRQGAGAAGFEKPNNPGSLRPGDMVLHRQPSIAQPFGYVVEGPNNGYFGKKEDYYCEGTLEWPEFQMDKFVPKAVLMPVYYEVHKKSADGTLLFQKDSLPVREPRLVLVEHLCVGDNVEFFDLDTPAPPVQRVIVAVDVVRRRLYLDEPLPMLSGGTGYTMQFMPYATSPLQVLALEDYETELGW